MSFGFSANGSALTHKFMPDVSALQAVISHLCLMSLQRQQQPSTIKSVITSKLWGCIIFIFLTVTTFLLLHYWVDTSV